MANKITTLLDLDATRFKSGMKAAQTSIRETDGTVNKAKAGWKSAFAEFAKSPAAIAGAGAAVGAFAAKAVSDASNLEESLNAVNVAYGTNADAVHELGEESVDAFGLSTRAFNEFSVQFSSFANALATGSGRQVSDVLQEMTTRVADFASVNNLDMAESARIFQSSLAGETEAIRRYGVDLSAAAVEQYALEKGLASSRLEMTEAIKVQARYELLMESTNKVAGDFANTTDSLANQQRIAAANLENLSAKFGSVLIPIVAEATQEVNNFISTLEDIPVVDLGAKIGLDPSNLVDLAKWSRKASSWLNAPAKIGELTSKRLIGAFDDVGKKFEWWGGEAKDAAIDFADADRQLAGAADAAADELERQAIASGEVAEATVDLGDKTNNAMTEGRNYTAVQEALAAQHERVLEVSEALEDAADERADAEREATRAAEEHRRAIDELVAAMDDQIAKSLELVGGDIAVRDAQRRAEDAATELTETLALEETTLRDAGAAIDDTASKYLNAAQVAADYTADQREANGETVDATEQARLLKDELQRLADQTTGPLHDALMGLIEDINAVPRNVDVNIVLRRNVSGDAGGVAFRGARAHGGRTYPGIHEVLEEGPELLQQDGKTFLLSNGGGNVVPLDQTPSNGPLPDGVGGTTARIINVNFYTPKLSPEDVVDAIRKYDRRNTR